MSAVSGFLALPLVLRTLGASDFGIFSVIAGSLSALLFINSALTGGAQRHIAYSLGEGSSEKAAQWFSTSLVIHAVLALGVLLASLLCSHWVIYRLLSLPPARLGAAMWTYRAVVVVLSCTIISTPYQALLMAKESFSALSLMAMTGSLFLVVGVFFLKSLPGDHLMWYSGIYAISDGFLLIGPVFFCLGRYVECQNLSSDALSWKKIKELLGFSSWNLLGTLAVQIRYQGPAILFNRFFGTTMNAANGIAMQVSGFASSVSTGLLTATSPPIVKAEGAGNRAEMLFLSNLSNKYAFVLLWLLVGPLLFEMNFCLSFWLRQMPPGTVVFSKILLIVLLLDMMTAGFTAAVQAEGRIAAYQSVMSFFLCVSVPVGYVLLRFHMPASSVLWAMAGGSVLADAGRLWFLCNKIGLKISQWSNGVLRPSVVTCAACCAAMGVVVISANPGFLRLASLYLVNSGIALSLAWAFASSEGERRLLQSCISKFQEQAFLGSRRVLAFAARRQ